MRGFINLSLLALKNNLIVFSTNRKIREFKKDSSDFILPKTLSLGEFLQKAIIVKNLSKCGEISQILYMQQACEKTKKITQALNFPSEFFEFMKNSEYLFKFFKELKTAKKGIKDIVLADTYDSYNEHLQILDELLKCYLEILKQNSVYDDISVCDLYEINESFIKEFENTQIYIDGFLSEFEFEIIAKCANLTNLKLIFKNTNFNKKVAEKIANLSGILPQEFRLNKEYTINLSQKFIEKSENLPKCAEILVKHFSLRSLQCAFVFEKISTFIKKGIKPENIAVILPDEEFADILRLHDKYNMLNFAMGKKIARTLFYRVLSKINESIKENAFVDFNAVKNEISNEYSLFFLQIGLKESLYERIKINFEQVVEFSEFSEIINEILSLKNENLNEFIAKPLFIIEIFLQKNTLCLKETIELFLMLLGDVKIPHIGGGAVSVLGVLESRGMKFDGVIIIDFNDDLVPNRSSGEMFLSSAVRKEAGLISHADRENLQRFYYESLINSAKFVAISYEKSEEKLKSRFLNNFSYKEDNEFSEDDYLQTFGNDQKMVMKNDEPIIKKEDFFKEALSFSRLNCYLECKRKYYYKYIEKIDENVLFNEIDNFAKGNVLHESFEEFYKENAKFDFDKFKIIYEKKAKNRHLNEFDIALNLLNIKKIADNFLFEHERDFSCKKCEFELNEREFNGIKIKGKIDRIDENGVGEIFVIDYKSGSKKDNSYQLAFYEALLDRPCKSKFIFFGSGEVCEAGKDFGVENLKILINELKYEFKNEVNFGRTTQGGKKPICEYCPYQIICKGKVDATTR